MAGHILGLILGLGATSLQGSAAAACLALQRAGFTWAASILHGRVAQPELNCELFCLTSYCCSCNSLAQLCCDSVPAGSRACSACSWLDQCALHFSMSRIPAEQQDPDSHYVCGAGYAFAGTASSSASKCLVLAKANVDGHARPIMMHGPVWA